MKDRFVCNYCKYSTNHRGSFNKHLQTKKHNKNYKIENTSLNDIIKELNKIKKTTDSIKKNIGANTVINNITFNVVLNQYCKNAVDINDFINGVNISAIDLEKTVHNGYVAGISNIFLKNLNYLALTQRPIHCINEKQKQFYIKSNDEWIRDNTGKMDDIISGISKKQVSSLENWEMEHPNWQSCAKEMEEYVKLIKEVTLSTKQNHAKIKKKIGNEILVKRDDFFLQN